MSFVPDKPFKTINEQIDILKKRGLKIEDDSIAKFYLQNLGYYPLINGYGKNFIKNENNNYFDNEVSFECLVRQYNLDRQLKQIVFQRIIDCENKLKTALGYVVAESFGVYDKTADDKGYIAGEYSYLNKLNYAKHSKLNNLISGLKKTRNECNSNPTSYYRNQKNHIPPWILFRNISLWHAITLFQVLKAPEKKKVTPLVLPNYENFDPATRSKIIVNCFYILKDFRNEMAHGSRIYALKTKHYLPLEAIEKNLGSGILTTEEYSSSVGKNDFYSLLLSIFILNDDLQALYSMIQDFKNLSITYSEDFTIEYRDISSYENFISFSNLPDNYIERLEKALLFKFNLNDL